MKNKLLKIGGIGTAVTAVCCFTPVLVIGATALGAAAVIAYLDMLLFPLLGIFLLMTVYGLRQWRQHHSVDKRTHS